MNDEKYDDITRCGNCGRYLQAEDKYCRDCGTKKGEGSFLPEVNLMSCLYGPPITEAFKCDTCGHSWVENSLGRSSTHYCPRCRSEKLDVKITKI